MNGSTVVLSSAKFTFNPILRWPSIEAKDWLQKFLVDARTNPNIISIVAIGSSVREDVISADLDLVVLVDEKLSIDFQRPPIDVDLRSFRACDVPSLVQEGNDLLGWSIKFGKPLLDKNNNWAKIVQALDSKVPLPSAKIALERAEKTNHLLKLLVSIDDPDAIHEQLLTLLTHVSRACLISHGIFPISRPELANQLREVSEHKLATLLEKTLKAKESPLAIYDVLKNLPEFQSFTN